GSASRCGGRDSGGRACVPRAPHFTIRAASPSVSRRDSPTTTGNPCSHSPNSASDWIRPATASRACGGTFDIDAPRNEVNELESRMAAPGFWERHDEAQRTVGKLKSAKKTLDDFGARARTGESLTELLDLAESEHDDSMLQEIERELGKLETDVADLETRSLLSGEHDRLGAIVNIHPGAGGTESQDWAEMLMRMYQRWGERRGYRVTVLDFQSGEEAGIKDATLEIDGEYAYGYLKAESGVHRLVRISPYDSNARRHTSFASVSVLPMVDDTVRVELKPDELKIDTFRAGGAGGQHVNKTESAVRITHLPTGIVVMMQEDRSQHRNRAKAMAVLRSRLYDHERQKLDSARAAARRGQVGTGARSERIRTYNYPQGRVSDHRINLTLYKLPQILEGEALGEILDALVQEHQAELLAAEDA